MYIVVLRWRKEQLQVKEKRVLKLPDDLALGLVAAISDLIITFKSRFHVHCIT